MNPRNFDYGQRIIPWTLTPILGSISIGWQNKKSHEMWCQYERYWLRYKTTWLIPTKVHIFVSVHIFSSYLYDWFLSIALYPQQKLFSLCFWSVSFLSECLYFYFPFILTNIPFPHRYGIPFMRFYEFLREDGADIGDMYTKMCFLRSIVSTYSCIDQNK